MKLHQLHIPRHKKPKRIGRGGKRGTTSGRGTKGQKSRAGRRIRPAMRDLIIRIPKRKGFRNKPTSVKPRILSLPELVRGLRAIVTGNAALKVNKDVLKKVGILGARFNGKVKVLGRGEIPFAIMLHGIAASKGVIAAIEKAGGQVTNVH